MAQSFRYHDNAARCRMARIKVVIHEVPRLLRDILRQAIAGAADMELLANRAATHNVWSDEDSQLVIITGATEREADRGAHDLLARFPRSHVLTIIASGDRVVMHELQPRSTELGALSPTELVGAIRAAVR